MNELTNKLVQEESRQGLQGIMAAHFTQGTAKQAGEKNNKRTPFKSDESDQQLKKKRKDNVCKFCKKPGHFQVDCNKRKAWFEKKGNPMGFVSYFESKLTDVPSSTWWIDTSANVHVSNSMQGFSTIQITNLSDQDFIFMEIKTKLR